MNAVSQILIGLPTGRALPKKFFGRHVGIVVFVVGDFEYELINLYAIVVHEARWGAYLGNC